MRQKRADHIESMSTPPTRKIIVKSIKNLVKNPFFEEKILPTRKISIRKSRNKYSLSQPKNQESPYLSKHKNRTNSKSSLSKSSSILGSEFAENFNFYESMADKFGKSVERKFKQSVGNHFVFPMSKERSEDSESSIQSLKKINFYKLKKQNDREPLTCQDKMIEMIIAMRHVEKPHLYKILNKDTKLFEEFSKYVYGVSDSKKVEQEESKSKASARNSSAGNKDFEREINGHYIKTISPCKSRSKFSSKLISKKKSMSRSFMDSEKN